MLACAATGLLAQGCYTLEQGYHQTRLILKRKPLEKVITEAKESEERLEKLRFVPSVLDYAKQNLGLEPGKSYRHYIGLEQDSVSYVVQAAKKREMELKTWWFPIVGSQPYLGFFKREDALKFRDKLVKEGFDTTLGGVEAFSLLGYFPDPIYSSMVDRNSKLELAELLFHECTHLTLYIPNFSSFNENLADFVARKSLREFFSEVKAEGIDLEAFEKRLEKERVAGPRYREFLIDAKKQLESFYAQSQHDERLKDDAAFLEERQKKFAELSRAYREHMQGVEKGTRFENYFREGKLNNAVILGYSLYEAKQEPFEKPFAKAGHRVAPFLEKLRACLKDVPESEDELWQKTENC